jgi:peptide/nickel transport system substrate-binding protein
METRKLRTIRLVVLTALMLSVFPIGWGVLPADCKTAVVVAQGTDPTRLDPDMHRDLPSNNVILHIYDSLVERGADAKLRPQLAESWRIIDGTTVEFRLRNGIKFSNGEPFNAEVVKYNFERVAGLMPDAKKTLNASDYNTIKEVKVIDDYTVQIITKHPDPLLLAYVAKKFIVPIKYTKQDNFESLATKPIGTGPYVLKSWMKGGELVLTAKKDYRKGAPKIDEVVFRPIPDDATRIAELKVGNVDIIANLKPDNVKEIEAVKQLEVKYAPSNRVVMLWINTELEKMKDARVRKAINHALDVPSLIKNVMGGNAYRLSTMCPKHFIGWDPEEKFYTYDPQKARKLLAEAGYPNGIDITILVPRGAFLNAIQATEAIAGMLLEVGIRAKLDAVEFGVFAKQTQAHQAPELMYAAWGNRTFDVYDTLKIGAKTGAMFSWYSNRKVDEYIDKAGQTADPEKHTEYLRLALREVWEDAGFGFLYAQRDIYGVNKRLVWEPRSDEEIHLYEAYVK